jgi:hypothetical protein
VTEAPNAARCGRAYVPGAGGRRIAVAPADGPAGEVTPFDRGDDGPPAEWADPHPPAG